jgi:hypothetical protein
MYAKRPYLPLVLLSAAIVLFFSPVLFTSRTYFLRDITYIFHPWKALTAEALQKGEMPLWNHYAYCGMPLLANWQSAVLYPFSQLFYLFPFPWALKTYHLFHVFLAGLFAYLFARGWRLSRWAAAGLMITFALNGYFITRLEFLSHVGVDIWLFAALLLSHDPLLLGITLSLAFLAGHQMFFVLLAAVISYLLVLPLPDARRGRLSVAGGAALVAGGLCAVQLVPTVELSLLSARVRSGLEASVAMLYSVKPSALAGLLTPLLSPGTAGVSGERLVWSSAFYIGSIGMIVAAYGALRTANTRLKLWALSLTAAGVLLSLGDSTPLYPLLLKHGVIFKYIRYPVQFMYLAMAGLGVLLSLGLDKIRSRFIIVGLVTAELFLWGYAFQPTAPDDFFYQKSATARFLQAQPDDGRFILSPGMEKDRRIPGRTVVEAWQTARGYLYSLTCLPYHIRNAYGFGEPLTLQATESAVDDAYRQKSPVDAFPFYSQLGVRSLVARTPLPATREYTIETRTPLYVYRLQGAPRIYETIDGDQHVNVSPRYPSFVKTELLAQADRQSTLLWREPRYPGFRVFVDGKAVPVSSRDTIFPTWDIPAGNSKSSIIYRPATFTYGIILSLCTLLLLGIISVRILVKIDRNGATE